GFEGATGNTGNNPPAWSMMGFVLRKNKPGGGWDAHVVFRGSQSGWAHRELARGHGHTVGNPDWVTDMDNGTDVAEPRTSPQGLIGRGFKNAVKFSLGTLAEALAPLKGGGADPDQIYATGHSLGAALAVQWCAAMTLGAYGGRYGSALPAAL